MYDLPTHVRLLLAELEMLPHGSTASWNPTGGGEGDDPRPPGCGNPPHLELRARYLKAETDADRGEAVAAMKRTLREYRGAGVDRSRVVGETRHDESLRILAEGEGFTPKEVALRFRCTPTRVRQLRLAADRDAELGHLVEPEAIAPEDDDDALIAAARRMKGRGMSVRLIGLELGRPKSTISDWLQPSKAAA